jgi:hypothetical protein
MGGAYYCECVFDLAGSVAHQDRDLAALQPLPVREHFTAVDPPCTIMLRLALLVQQSCC